MCLKLSQIHKVGVTRTPYYIEIWGRNLRVKWSLLALKKHDVQGILIFFFVEYGVLGPRPFFLFVSSEKHGRTSTPTLRRRMRSSSATQLVCAALAAALCLANGAASAQTPAGMPVRISSSVQRCQSVAFISPPSSASCMGGEGDSIADACTGQALRPLTLRKPERERTHISSRTTCPRMLGRDDDVSGEEDDTLEAVAKASFSSLITRQGSWASKLTRFAECEYSLLEY